MYLDGITDFIFVEEKPQRADVIFVPGGGYPEAAERAAALYREGYAPYICPSGRFSKSVGHFQMQEPGRTGKGLHGSRRDAEEAQDVSRTDGWETEWDYLREILLRHGVPDEAILREREAEFTWENAIFSREACEKAGIRVRRAILCCQNWHARRCLMYYGQQFPDTEMIVCPVETRGITKENWYLDPNRADVVLSEVERCGAQFHEIVRHFAEGSDYRTPDDWTSPLGR